MRRALALLAPSLVLSCAALLGLPDPALDETITPNGDASADGNADLDAGDGAVLVDAAYDGPCNTRAPFATITRLDTLASTDIDEQPSLTDDERTIWFLRSNRTQGSYKFMRATRSSPDGGFGDLREYQFPPVFTSPQSPRIVSDGTQLFYSVLTDPSRGYEIGSSSVTDAGVDMANTTNYPLINTTDYDVATSFAADQTMYLFRVRPGQPGMPSTFEVAYSPFTSNTYEKTFPVPGIAASPICTTGCAYPTISRNQRTMYLLAAAPNGQVGGVHAYRRNDASASFNQAVEEPLLKGDAVPGWLSADECRLYFNKTGPAPGDGAPADTDIYVAEKPR